MDDLRLGIGASRHTDYFKLSEQLDETQLSYLRAIGAVGPPVTTDPGTGDLDSGGNLPPQ